MNYHFELVPPPVQDWGAYRQRQLSDIQSIMYHRIGPQLPFDGKQVDLESAEQIAAWFRVNGPKEIGSAKMPYSFVIPKDGLKVYQAVPLRCVTPHALSWNWKSVSVAFIGDFRPGKGKPTYSQAEAAKWVSQRIVDTLGRQVTLERHSLAPGGTDNPQGHECPGADFLPAFEAIEAYVKDAFLMTK